MAQLTMEEITATLNPKVSYLDMAGIKQTQLEADICTLMYIHTPAIKGTNRRSVLSGTIPNYLKASYL